VATPPFDAMFRSGYTLCRQALIVTEARLADAAARASRDALLVSIETSLLPRLQRWSRHRMQLERNRRFFKRFYWLTNALKLVGRWSRRRLRQACILAGRLGRWCVAAEEEEEEKGDAAEILRRRRRERSRRRRRKRKERGRRWHSLMSLGFRRRRRRRLGGELLEEEEEVWSPAALRREEEEEGGDIDFQGPPHDAKGELNERIERCEMVIEYLNRVMRHQLKEVGRLQHHLWTRPRAFASSNPTPNDHCLYHHNDDDFDESDDCLVGNGNSRDHDVGANVQGRPSSRTRSIGIGWKREAALRQWARTAMALSEIAIKNPLVLEEEEEKEENPQRMTAGDEEHWWLNRASKWNANWVEGYGANVDVCLRANDELRLSLWEKLEKHIPTALTLCVARWLQAILPTDPNTILRLASSARATMLSIWQRHVLSPARAIINDLLFQDRMKLLNAGAIEDARSSLQQMMRSLPASSPFLPSSGFEIGWPLQGLC